MDREISGPGARVRITPTGDSTKYVARLAGHMAVIVSGPSKYDGLYLIRPDGDAFEGTAPRYVDRDEFEVVTAP